MVDVTGLKSPFTRKFNGETYRIECRAQTKRVADKIAKSLRKNGKKVRIVKLKKGAKYAIYMRNR